MLKNRGNKVKMKLFEKSYHKSVFLREVVRKLNLDIEIIHKDIFEIEELNAGTIIARAFKPMPVILRLVNEKFKEYKNLILFMGKNGEKTLEDTLKIWDFDFSPKSHYELGEKLQMLDFDLATKTTGSRFVFVKNKLRIRMIIIIIIAYS